MKIEIVDNTVLLDGVKYIREEKKKTLPSEPKFEIGKWYFHKGPCLTDEIFRLDSITGGYAYYYNIRDNRDCFNIKSGFAKNTRPATPTEVETHLRKICDEKYVGKKVSVIENKITNERHPDPYVSQYDQYWMVDTKGRGVLVYENGKFAEIIPDKKPFPKTREEFKRYNTAWSEFWLKTPTGSKHDDNVVSFLDQYYFNE